MRNIFIITLSAGLLASCASTSVPEQYLALECDDLRALSDGQTYAAFNTGLDAGLERAEEERRLESGSPWFGRGRTADDNKVLGEKQDIRKAYLEKGC